MRPSAKYNGASRLHAELCSPGEPNHRHCRDAVRQQRQPDRTTQFHSPPERHRGKQNLSSQNKK